MDASLVISAIHRHISHTVNIVNVNFLLLLLLLLLLFIFYFFYFFFFIPALICKYFFTLIYIYLFCVP